VGSDSRNLLAASAGTVAVVSTANVPTGAMVRRPETAFPDQSGMCTRIDAVTRAERNVYLNAQQVAERLFGTDQVANMVLLGAAYQAGRRSSAFTPVRPAPLSRSKTRKRSAARS
jgi:indolepyruvate ferredoxin oxidoreductase